MEREDPVELFVTLPADCDLDGSAVRRYLEDELRTRAEITAADGSAVTVRIYRREEVEAVADELVLKLSKLEACDGCVVKWTSDDGTPVARPI